MTSLAIWSFGENLVCVTTYKLKDVEEVRLHNERSDSEKIIDVSKVFDITTK